MIVIYQIFGYLCEFSQVARLVETGERDLCLLKKAYSLLITCMSVTW
jgi:hypothetical protein